MSDTASETRISVWDPLVRLGHWALVAAFTIAYLTGEDNRAAGDWHEWAGYAAGAIVAWRILWGLIGPRYARFSDFLVWPRSALIYLIDLIFGRSRRYVGHSPAGGAMIIALLGLIAVTIITGIVADEGYEQAPPPAVQASVMAPAGNPKAEDASTVRNVPAAKLEGKESLIGELHDALANITLFLVIFHVLGVALASFVHRENLVAAMVTGKKRADDALN